LVWLGHRGAANPNWGRPNWRHRKAEKAVGAVIPADITSEIPTGDRSIWDILEDAKWHPDRCPTEHLLDLEFWIQEVLARRQKGSDKASKPA
jgi:hypothetical protein